MDIANEFVNVWKKFMEMSRAKLIDKSKQGTLNAAAANMAVQEAVSLCLDPYHMFGMWLANVKSYDAAAAERIQSILYDIRFENQVVEKKITDLGVAGIATGSAVIGAGIAKYLFSCGTLGTVLSAVLPATFFYQSMKTQQKNEDVKIQKEMILMYLGQLELVREEIEGVIGSIQY